MLTPNSLESSKIELALEINSFDKPRELSQVAAWSQLMLNLIFLKPGTYPSLPEMGVGIEDFQYEYIDEAVNELSARINDQQKTYLPDVPLTGLRISTVEHRGQPILIIHLFFDTTNGVEGSAIAVNVSKRKFLDFDISW